MVEPLDEVFVREVNDNLGIAHKVSRLYFTDPDEREDVILMRKFKGIATAKPPVQAPGDAGQSSLHHYIERRRNLLDGFYRFKQRYELLLIPLASAIGVFITFELYVPGGVEAYQNEAIIVFAITLTSCAAAIRAENRKNFREPIEQFDRILEEFKAAE